MKTLFLDFGNVVAFFDHRKATRQLAALAPTPIREDAIFAHVFGTPLESDYDCGRLSTAAFVANVRESFGLQATDQQIAEAWSDIFTPNDALTALLPQLKRTASNLVLASNTNELHFQRIAQQFAEPLSWFTGFVLSFEVGARKPAPEFFVRCLTVARAQPADCVFVDDRREFVDAARQMGMSGVVYQENTDLLRAFAEVGL